MRNLVIALFLLVGSFNVAFAQRGKAVAEGTEYYLPRTELRFTVKIEKTSYTPGDFAIYAEKYLKMR